MFAYRTPGVYFEWLDQRTPPVAPLRTDVAGFVGIAAGGPLDMPVRIESFTQFASTFGGHAPQGYLAYAVEGFFANGGRTCWIVRAADPRSARPAVAELLDAAGQPTLRLSAVSRVVTSDGAASKFPNPGSWGELVRFSLAQTARDRFSLFVRLGNAQEIWRDLSMNPNDARYVVPLLNDESSGSGLVWATELNPPDRSPGGVPDPLAKNLRGGAGRLEGGDDGLAALTPQDFTGEGAPASLARGLAALERIDEVSVVAMPDIMPMPQILPKQPRPRPRDCSKLDAEPDADAAQPAPSAFAPPFTPTQIQVLQSALIAHCEKLQDRVAILDPRPDDLAPEQVALWRTQFDTKYAALYYPWLMVPDPLRLEGLLRPVPPSGHLAGVYARGDLRAGVHKPPANEELEGVKDLRVAVDDIRHGDLNEQGVNVIRGYAGRGVRVAGARTLSSDAAWRFVNVRRLVTMIEEAIDEQTQWTVFEPNSPDLWREVDRVVRNFLLGLWRRGMLDGATPEEAFYVRCDETTNPPAETEAGRMTCEVGVRPPHPAEFVVVRIGKTEGGTEIFEFAGGI